MNDSVAPTRDPPAPTVTFAELFTPKLVTVFREGYGLGQFRADAFAGLTVAIIALPLSMAIAIASGVDPARGLYAAIVGGFLVSALGGSRFQVGGPAGAFIILVAATGARHGLDGLLLATFLSGLMLAAAGFLRLGAYIRLVPYPVTVGFTAGIAVIIFASQLKDLFGLSVAGNGAHSLIETLGQAGGALHTANPYALAISAGTVALILGLRRLVPALPGMLIAVILAGAATAALNLPVETIGSRFGGVPSGAPSPVLPSFSFEKILAVLPDAFAFTLLGAIESLLSATVADGMTGRRHRSNCELVAQGAANVASSLFGGLVVTGTIARTAANARAGAHGPVAGMLHSLFLLGFMLFAAPLAAFAPLAALAGVLAVVAWNMIERHAVLALFGGSKGDMAAMLATFLLTIFRDLTTGIVAGVAIGALAFINRMAETAQLKSGAPLLVRDRADGSPESRTAYKGREAGDRIAVFRVTGALFFGSAASLGAALDRLLSGQEALALDFSEAALIDSSGAQAVKGFIAKARRQGVRVVIAAADAEARQALYAGGVSARDVIFAATLDDAIDTLRAASGDSAID